MPLTEGRFFVDRLTGPDIKRGVECRKAAIALDPGFAQAYAALSRAHSYEGGWGLRTPQEATALAREAALRSLALEPDLVEALARLKAACADLSAFQIAQVHAVRGEVDDAFAWLERAFDQRDAGVSVVGISPWFDNIQGDPRWGKFLRKVGLGG